MSDDILDHLFLFHPEAILHRDAHGRTPFECAIEQVENSSSDNIALLRKELSTIKFLADEYPMVLSEQNHKGATPLMQAIDEYGITSTEVISSLLTDEAARLADNDGRLVRYLQLRLTWDILCQL